MCGMIVVSVIGGAVGMGVGILYLLVADNHNWWPFN